MEHNSSQPPPIYVTTEVDVHPFSFFDPVLVVHEHTHTRYTTHTVIDTVHQSPPAEVVHGPVFRGPDVTYLKTPCGIAKIVAAVSILIVNDLWL